MLISVIQFSCCITLLGLPEQRIIEWLKSRMHCLAVRRARWIQGWVLLSWGAESFSCLSQASSDWLAILGVPSFVEASPQSLPFCSMAFFLSACCSVTESCLALCDPMDCSTSGSSLPCYLLELAQIHIH